MRSVRVAALAVAFVLVGLFTSAASAVTANDDSTTTTEGTPVTYNVGNNDDPSPCFSFGVDAQGPYFDGEPATLSTTTAEGLWESDGQGSITYTPAPGFTGPAAVTYYINCNGFAASESSATFTVTVGPEAEIPFTSPIVGAAAAVLAGLGAGAWYLLRRREGGLA